MLLSLAAVSGCATDWVADTGRLLHGIGHSPDGAGTLTENDIAAGLREALAQGVTRAIDQLGRIDGYWGNADLRIPLPKPFSGIEKTLRQFGQGQRLDDFQLTLNRAAEQAVPQVAGIFGEAVRQMSLADARDILAGPTDAATQYFRAKAGESLRQKILPIVQNATEQTGVTQSYKKLASKAGPILQYAGKGSVADIDLFVTDRALDGLYATIAAEEARIRENPAARGSEILQRVFGGR